MLRVMMFVALALTVVLAALGYTILATLAGLCFVGLLFANLGHSAPRPSSPPPSPQMDLSSASTMAKEGYSVRFDEGAGLYILYRRGTPLVNSQLESPRNGTAATPEELGRWFAQPVPGHIMRELYEKY